MRTDAQHTENHRRPTDVRSRFRHSRITAGGMTRRGRGSGNRRAPNSDTGSSRWAYPRTGSSGRVRWPLPAADHLTCAPPITKANADIVSIQEHFIRDGYSCTYDEIIATMNRQAASASASSGAQ